MVRLYHRDINRRKTRKSLTLLGFLDVEEVYVPPVSAWKIVRASSFTAIELEAVTKRRTKRNGDGTRNCLFGSYKRGFS